MKRVLFIGFSLIAAQNFSNEFCAIDHAFVSVYAVRCDPHEVLIEQNSDTSVIPASCMKIVTTAAALHLLDPESRFVTLLEYDGYIDEEKTLHGNLYIRGGGDPCLGSDRIAGALSWEKQIEAWKDAVKELGIRKIEGNVIGDASKWEKALAVPSWTWEDLGNYYGAGASALSFHENSYSLFFNPGEKIGEPARIIRPDPPLSSLRFQNEVTTGPEGSGDQACIYGAEFSTLQFIRGSVPAGLKRFSIKGAIPDPAASCAELFFKKLQQEGIAIEQKELSQKTNRLSFSATYSPTMKEIVHHTNRNSVNLFAEHLLKQMGWVVYQEGSTAAGIRAVRDFWASQNMDLSGFNMVDGSGLSRKNLVTAKQLVEMLIRMKKSKAFPVFFESLPELENGIKAKSGSMSLIKAYAGYIEDVAFAIIVNQCLDSKLINEAIKSALSKLHHKLTRDASL